MPAAVLTTLPPAQTSNIVLMSSYTTPIHCPSADHGSTPPADDGDRADSYPYCLYLLVCAATKGPRAGLFKLGIADRFAARHQEHTRVWGAFDLHRSALLRARSRREVIALETALKHVFGDPAADHRARIGGRVLSSKELIALGSWRRHPGSSEKGYTEFYALECFEAVLAFAAHWLAQRGQRAAGARLQRGISLSECSLQAQTADPSLTRAQARELRVRRRAVVREFTEKVRAESDRLLTRVRAFALEHQEHLLAVDLQGWRRARATRDATQGRYGFVSLYFRTLEDDPRHHDPRLPAWEAAQRELQAEFAPITTLAHTVGPHGQGRRLITSGGEPARRCVVEGFSEGIATLLSLGGFSELGLPRPFPTELVRVCAGNGYSQPFHPAYETFAELAQALEGRRPRRQGEFCY